MPQIHIAYIQIGEIVMDQVGRESNLLGTDAHDHDVANRRGGLAFAEWGDEPDEMRHSGAGMGPMLWSAAQFVLDQLPVGVALTDAAMRVTVTNRALDARIQVQDGVTLHDQVFALTDPEAHQQLTSRIGEAISEGSAPAKFALRARRGSSRPDLHVLVMPVRHREWCIWVFDPLGPRDLSSDLLRDLHGLTEAESKVASALFMGRSTKEAAAALGISVNTVKAHLKGIFRKCGVRSQAELSQLLALGCWSL